jgi:LmbE family N-acetylglucosaminyl deacetylase
MERRPDPRSVRLVLGLLGVLATVLGLMASGAAWLFEEPAAAVTRSVVHRLGVRSVLAVFAHPDDEIDASALLHDATARGLPVYLVTASQGEQARPGVRSDALGAIRRAEVMRYGRLLGVREQEVWRYPDHDLARVPRQEIVERLTMTLRRWHPDLVVTYDPRGGFTGHPDHQVIARATVEAVRKAAAGPEPARPKAMAFLVAPRRVARLLGGDRGVRVAREEPPPDVAVPVDRAAKVKAWEVHQSQAGYVRRTWHVPPWLLYTFYDAEHYAIRSLN